VAGANLWSRIAEATNPSGFALSPTTAGDGVTLAASNLLPVVDQTGKVGDAGRRWASGRYSAFVEIGVGAVRVTIDGDSMTTTGGSYTINPLADLFLSPTGDLVIDPGGVVRPTVTNTEEIGTGATQFLRVVAAQHQTFAAPADANPSIEASIVAGNARIAFGPGAAVAPDTSVERDLGSGALLLKTLSNVRITSGAGLAPLNVAVLAADPGAPANGDFWLFDNGVVRAFRMRAAGVTYSAVAV